MNNEKCESVLKSSLSVGAKALYLYFLTKAENGELCGAGNAIAREIGISYHSFLRYRKELVESGLVEIENRHEGGIVLENRYKLLQEA